MSAPAPPFLGRVILVTACASPIGRALSVKLAAEGANLCLTDPSKSDGGELCQVCLIARPWLTSNRSFAQASPNASWSSKRARRPCLLD